MRKFSKPVFFFLKPTVLLHPYYLISFWGNYYKENKNIKEQLDKIFYDESTINGSYNLLKDITTKYFKMYVDEHKEDYNKMIKQKSDEAKQKSIIKKLK